MIASPAIFDYRVVIQVGNTSHIYLCKDCCGASDALTSAELQYKRDHNGSDIPKGSRASATLVNLL